MLDLLVSTFMESLSHLAGEVSSILSLPTAFLPDFPDVLDGLGEQGDALTGLNPSAMPYKSSLSSLICFLAASLILLLFATWRK